MVSMTSKQATGNDAFEGYAIDLITEVAKILSKSTQIQMVKQLYKSLFYYVHYNRTQKKEILQGNGKLPNYKKATGNDAFEGYAIDLITEVAKILSKFTQVQMVKQLYKSLFYRVNYNRKTNKERESCKSMAKLQKSFS